MALPTAVLLGAWTLSACRVAVAAPIEAATTTTTAAPLSPTPSQPPDYLTNGTTSDELILVYPLSGYYAPLQRGLYWAIICFTILGLGNMWLVTAAFGTAMTYSSVAAMHAIAIYAVRSTAFFDADSLAICEILFCTSVLLPSWLVHYRRLRSTTAQIVLRLWGALMFIGCVIAFVHVVKINSSVVAQRNDCLSDLAAAGSGQPDSWQVLEWVSSPAVQQACGDWKPYENVTLQPMRTADEVVMARNTSRLGTWMIRITVLAGSGCGLCILFIALGFLWPNSASLDRHRRQQAAKRRRTGRNAKGNHPGDTLQMPLAWCVGVVTFVFFEITLALMPVAEGPRAIGQWGPWVAAVFVVFAVLVNHHFEAPIDDMRAALARALGPTIWFVMDWRGKAPSPTERRRSAAAKREAYEREMRSRLERERRANMTTNETQTEKGWPDDDNDNDDDGYDDDDDNKTEAGGQSREDMEDKGGMKDERNTKREEENEIEISPLPTALLWDAIGHIASRTKAATTRRFSESDIGLHSSNVGLGSRRNT